VPALQVMLDIAQPPARKIVHHANFRAALHQRIYKTRTDKRCTSSDKNFLIVPDGALQVSLARLLLE
jgi:hypothetical protein